MIKTGTSSKANPIHSSNMANGLAEIGVREAFTAFYEGWLIKHQEFLEKLLACVAKEDECTDMVAHVLAHYQEFFQEKAKAASEDVFLVMSPPWFSSLERTLIWISAFKPSMVFPLIKNSVGEELSAEQEEKIGLIKADTRRQEKEVEEELASVQESVAGTAVFYLVRRFERLVDAEISELNNAMEELKAAMLVVMENADALRELTIKKVMEVLKPMQNVKFLAAAGQFVVQARRWGVHKDSQRATTTSAEGPASHA